MARRNPMNERYGKNTAPSGKTRKSAAAAKPKRPTATGSSKSGSSAKKPAGKPARVQMAIHPPTPEYRLWRRIWLGLMVSALALVGASFWLMRRNDPVGTYVLVATYVLLGAGVAIDFFKLRKLRMEWQQSGGKQVQKTDSPGSSDTSDKTASDDDR